MTAINPTIATPSQIAEAAKVTATCEQAYKIIFLFCITALTTQGIFISLIFIVEYSGINSIFSYMMQGTKETDKIIDEDIIAFMCVIVICCYHILKKIRKQSLPLKLLEDFTEYFMACYLLGMGALFSVLIYNSGIDGLFMVDNMNSFASWGEQSAQAVEEPFMKSIINFIFENGAFFLIIGCAGFTLFCCVSVSYLWDKAEQNFKEITTKRSRANTALEAFNTIQNNEIEYAKTYSEWKSLDEEEKALNGNFKNKIETKIQSLKLHLEDITNRKKTLGNFKNQIDEILQTPEEKELRNTNDAVLEKSLCDIEKWEKNNG